MHGQSSGLGAQDSRLWIPRLTQTQYLAPIIRNLSAVVDHFYLYMGTLAVIDALDVVMCVLLFVIS